MNRRPLTARQREALDYLYWHTLTNGYQPSVRDMITRFGWRSTNAATCVLRAIERKGYIKLGSGRMSRALVLLDWHERLRQHAQRVVEHDDVRDWALG